MTVQLTGGGLPDLQVPDQVLDLDRRRIRPFVGGDIDLAPVVLDVTVGIGVVVAHLDQQLHGQIHQLRRAGDPAAPELFTMITHRLGQPISRFVGCRNSCSLNGSVCGNGNQEWCCTWMRTPVAAAPSARVVSELLFGLQQRTTEGMKTKPFFFRRVADHLRAQEAPCLDAASLDRLALEKTTLARHFMPSREGNVRIRNRTTQRRMRYRSVRAAVPTCRRGGAFG
ncbi:hypothetical protein ABTW96_03795 [Nocardia beijingensis]|uniref:hypothetical protein n=1 Tax=Nocardia beijingensis TaxID=95162 RepID=UPI003326115C